VSGLPPADDLARAEAAGWAAVRAAGLDPSDDGHLWQAVFYGAQRAALDAVRDGEDVNRPRARPRGA
jgi:hypothetical protein